MDRGAHPHPDRHGLAGDTPGRGDEGHGQGGPDDQGHRPPVEVGIRILRRRHPLHEQHVDAQGADPGDAAQGRALSTGGRPPAGGPGRAEDPPDHHGQRRDPFMGGPGPGHQAGRDSGLHPRHLVQGRKARRLPRAMHRAVRRRPRLHAGRGQRRHAGGIRGLEAGTETATGGGRRQRGQDVCPGGAQGHGRKGLRIHPARSATRPTAWAFPTSSRRWPARRSPPGTGTRTSTSS